MGVYLAVDPLGQLPALQVTRANAGMKLQCGPAQGRLYAREVHARWCSRAA
jgi:hypothetical protein